MKRKICFVVSAFLALAMALPAIAAAASYDDNAPITVWIDTPRQALATAYYAAHPDMKDKVTFELVDRMTVLYPKINLFNNTGEGWPDVVFGEPFLQQYINTKAYDYFPMDLRDWIPKSVIDNFVPGSMDTCLGPKGEVIALRNDIAPVVMWYNKTLMDKFGYKLPATWEEYQALGAKVAKDHPGYILGSAYEAMAIYFASSNAPIAKPLDTNTVYINVADPKSVRVAKMMDAMLKNGSLSNLSYWDAKFAKLASEDKILMLPAAAWFNGVFGGKPESSWYKSSKHQLAATTMPKWADEPKAYTGTWGGSAWSMSRHTKNPKLAAEVMLFAVTNTEVALQIAGFPAYKPAAEALKASMTANPLFASSPYDVIAASMGMVAPNYNDSVRYNLEQANKPVDAAIESGKSILSALPDWQALLKSSAERESYRVVTTQP